MSAFFHRAKLERVGRLARIALCVAINCSALLTGFAAEVPESPEVLYCSTPQGAIAYFSNTALLVDRGLTRSPFYGSTDELILGSLIRPTGLRDFLEITPEQLASLQQRSKPQARNPSAYNAEATQPFDTVSGTQARKRLTEILVDDQVAKLPIVYLALEGLTALRREEFHVRLGLSQDQVKEIIDLSSNYSERARNLHKAIFGLSNEELQSLPKINLELRMLSAALDHEIAEILRNEQHKRLVELIERAIEVSDRVHGPGVGLPKRIALAP